jgi:hypothetical protein
MAFDPKIWGPHYWFTLHTIAITYPTHPNDVVKKKYYDFIQNLPLFIPNPKIGDQFTEYLDKFPVTPYLDSRMSFMKWVHFLHNKINMKLGYEIMDFDESIKLYYDLYKPKNDISYKIFREKHKFIFGISVFLGILLFVYLYNK